MVGFGRNKKSTATFSDGVGQIDGSSLLDDNGEPNVATLYDTNNNSKKTKLDVKSRNPEDDDCDETTKPPARRSWFRLGRSSKK
ncbi:hypothetical protein DYB32_002084 [Aphanomyces invadans]|uniref:Uncharacterized protein n=1 Tax=Aphanomyces invadans TaxID=157072 RepID=A0A3R6Z8X1_9STRA|nr:hypothetical protein DYB32_002084 [Aphanomyces invadans]